MIRHLPNFLTLLRLVLTLPLVLAIMHHAFIEALILLCIAGCSDALDGLIARRMNYVTRLGSILDPIVDKIFVLSCYITLMFIGQLPGWLVYTIIARDLFILCGASLYHLVYGAYEFKPTVLGKLNTFLELLLLTLVLIDSGLVKLSENLLVAVIFLLLSTTIMSGLEYFIRSLYKEWKPQQ